MQENQRLNKELNKLKGYQEAFRNMADYNAVLKREIKELNARVDELKNAKQEAHVIAMRDEIVAKRDRKITEQAAKISEQYNTIKRLVNEKHGNKFKLHTTPEAARARRQELLTQEIKEQE